MLAKGGLLHEWRETCISQDATLRSAQKAMTGATQLQQFTPFITHLSVLEAQHTERPEMWRSISMLCTVSDQGLVVCKGANVDAVDAG